MNNEVEVIDIDSRKEGVAGRLSNLTDRGFLFRGNLCRALEGPLQALKFSNPVTQQRICMLSGRDAQKRGQTMNEEWMSNQILWWGGKKIPRNSTDYQKFLDELFATAFDSVEFQEDLLSTGNAELVHTIGKNDRTKTVLTVEEFCSRLMNERRKIRRARGLLTIEDMNDAAKKIELDGIGAYNAVKEMYSEQVAKLLLAAHLRHGERNQERIPETLLEKILDDLVIQQLSEL